MNAAWSHIAHRAGVLSREPMSRHTSWRVGGAADLYFKPTSAHELTAFLAQAELKPVSIEKVNVPKIWSLITCIKD